MRVTNFRYIEPLFLARYPVAVTGIFVVAEDYTVAFDIDGKPATYTVPAHTPTDLASIPRIVPRFIAEKVNGHIEAAVVHDRLCLDRGPYTSDEAAAIFEAAMLAAHVPAWRRKMMVTAVRKFGPKWE